MRKAVVEAGASTPAPDDTHNLVASARRRAESPANRASCRRGRGGGEDTSPLADKDTVNHQDYQWPQLCRGLRCSS